MDVYTNEPNQGRTSIPRAQQDVWTPCWLQTNVALTRTSKTNQEIPKVIDPAVGLTPVCPDNVRRDMAPHHRTTSGLTIGIPYYASPAMLLQQLSNFATYPTDIQKHLTIIIVDDGSPLGLRAEEYTHHESFLSSIHFRLRIARITTEIRWNVEGSRNLAFYLGDTRRGLMLDLDMLVPVETMRKVLEWNTTTTFMDHESTTKEVSVAHKFNRRKPNGRQSMQPAVAFLDIPEYWNSGGLDEDFAGEYGFGTEPHFWHMWKKGSRVVVSHNDTYINELTTDPCDAAWLSNPDLLQRCKSARAGLPELQRDKKPNKLLWKLKKRELLPWSNSYLRFNWTVSP